jgi:hypothetical protein
MIFTFVQSVYDDGGTYLLRHLQRAYHEVIELSAQRIAAYVRVATQYRNKRISELWGAISKLVCQRRKYKTDVASILNIARAKETTSKSPLLSRMSSRKRLGNGRFATPRRPTQPVDDPSFVIFLPPVDFVQLCCSGPF